MAFAGQAEHHQLFPFQTHSLKTDHDSKNELRGTNYQIVKDQCFAANKIHRQSPQRKQPAENATAPTEDHKSDFRSGHVSYRLIMACQQATANQKCFAVRDHSADLPRR